MSSTVDAYSEKDTPTACIKRVRDLLAKGGFASYKPILPLIFSLNGHPFTLERVDNVSPGYFPFETFYRTRLPRRTLFKTARQVSKSTSLAARGILHSLTCPYFKTLYIMPLYEMVRRFSQNYVKPFIETSPVKELLLGDESIQSVLQRTFANRSMMIFSYAFQNCDRVRGISANKNAYDEIQDLDKDFMPIIRETLSGSPYGLLEEMAGTPKGLENTVQGLWEQSSQAEWAVKCTRCGHWNIPALGHDLDKMIGPHRDDLSFDNPGVVCARCREPRSIFPHTGRWVHAYPERRWSFAGYHIPQIILPMHYADPEKWGTLLGKREGAGNTPINVFYNEVLGESYDTGSRLITLTDLKKACVLPWPNQLSEALAACDLDSYVARVLACDWGGGGEEEMSFTVYSVLGMRSDGKIDVIFGYRSLTPHDHVREARLAIGLASKFKCQAIAHDYTGAGALRETLIVQAGYPLGQIIPVAYVRASATLRPIQFKAVTKANPRPHYQVDKTRTLQLTCNQIKNGWIRFFQWDYHGVDDTGLVYDFLALVDEKIDSRIGKDIYVIVRDPHMRDDFAQAVNIGCCALWHMTDKWPDLAGIAHLRAPEELLTAIQPPDRTPITDLL